MKNTTVDLVCDHIRHGGQEVDAVGTRRFTFDGVDYEIDLCTKDDDQMDRDLAPWLDAARIVKPTGRRVVKRSAASRRRNKAIRTWAAERGIPLEDRGRLPDRVVRQYEQRAA